MNKYNIRPTNGVAPKPTKPKKSTKKPVKKSTKKSVKKKSGKTLSQIDKELIELRDQFKLLTEKIDSLSADNNEIPMDHVKRACRSWLTTRIRARKKDIRKSLEAEMWHELNAWLQEYPTEEVE